MGSQRVGCDFVVVEQEQRTVEPLGECCVCVCVCVCVKYMELMLLFLLLFPLIVLKFL